MFSILALLLYSLRLLIKHFQRHVVNRSGFRIELSSMLTILQLSLLSQLVAANKNLFSFHTLGDLLIWQRDMQLLEHNREKGRSFSQHLREITEFESILVCSLLFPYIENITWDWILSIWIFPEMPSRVTFFFEILREPVLGHTISSLLPKF